MKHFFLLLCLCSVGFFVFGFLYQPSIASVTLTNNFHAGVWNQGLDLRLVFLNGDQYDPDTLESHYSGNIEKSFYFSTLPGIYYRYILTDLDTHWVCLFSPWYLVGIFAFLVFCFQLQENFYRNVPGKTDPDDSKNT